MMRRILFLTLLALLAAPAAWADAIQDFNAGVSEAYGGYRAGTSYLRTGNPGLASLEIATALEAWRGILATFADTPPAPYANDQDFAATLSGIEAKLSKALTQAENGDSKAAAETLLPVRDMIYSLRSRNGVRLYADCITELNRAVEPLFKHRHDTPDLDNEQVRAQITRESKTYENLLIDCRKMAPETYTGDQEFVRLFDGTLESIQSMYPAIDSKDPGRVINVLRELRSFDRIIYFRFGG